MLALPQVETFLIQAILSILKSRPMPIHLVSKIFERTFQLPFRAFRQPSFVEFISHHPQFVIVDAYVAKSGTQSFPPPMGAGPRYYALCDALEEQDVIIWRSAFNYTRFTLSLIFYI